MTHKIMATQTELLQQPIACLPLSGDLKALLSFKGYTNLQHLLQQKVSNLTALEKLQRTNKKSMPVVKSICQSGQIIRQKASNPCTVKGGGDFLIRPQKIRVFTYIL